MSEKAASVRPTLRQVVLYPLFGAIIVSAVFLALIQRLLSESEALRHSEEVIATAEQIRNLAVDMETGIRGYLLTRDRRFFEPYDNASRSLPIFLRQLKTLVRDNPEQQRRVALIGRDIAEWQRFAIENIRSPVPERELIVGKLLMDRVRADHQEFLAVERSLSRERVTRVRETTIAAIAVTIAVAILAGAILTFFVRRELNGISRGYEAALAAAAQLAIAKDRMLATVSHELRTPLTSILGWSSMLRAMETDPETTRLALASIEQSARLQSRLVEDLIDVSRATAGKLRIEMAEINLRQVLESTVETTKPAASAKGILVSTSIADADRTIAGDAARLQQVFWNLLNNAVRFTPSGGQIDVSAVTGDQSVFIRVRDTGAGIDPAFLPFVFDPFAQQNESNKPYAGLGLGLAIARRLVELHGGTIVAKSDGPGRGAEFSVGLPLSAPAPQPLLVP